MTELKVVKDRPAPMAHWVEDYLTACRSRGVKLSTIRDAYGYPLRSVFLPWCDREGITAPSQIDKRRLEGFAAGLRSEGGRSGRPLSENTVWTYLKSVNQLLGWAAAEGDGEGARVKLRKPPGRKVVVLERDQIKALERAALTERDKVIIRLLADTGLRPGELVSIRGGDVQRSARRHYVRVRGKTGEREPLTVNGVRQAISDLALDVGLKAVVTPYTFRHSACHWMLVSGMATVEVASILGHGSERMIAEHYANIGREDSHDKLMALLRAET